jgi:hypothetical protein
MKTNRTAIMLIIACALWAQSDTTVVWRHLSTKSGDLPAPNSGTEQTSATVFDIDKDGISDFVITKRIAAPMVVWYGRGPGKKTRKKTRQPELRDYAETSPRRGRLSGICHDATDMCCPEWPATSPSEVSIGGKPTLPIGIAALIFGSCKKTCRMRKPTSWVGASSNHVHLIAVLERIRWPFCCGVFTDATHNTTTRARGGRVM